MKKYLFSLLIFQVICISGVAQDLDKVYVRVPQKYQFLEEKNQYQLNALTAFLFEKEGLEAIFDEPQPTGLHPCNIFQVDVHDDSNYFTTKLYISLTNCNNEVVYKSKVGTSREKEYKAAFQEALRKAAESLSGVASELKSTGNNSKVVSLKITSEEAEAKTSQNSKVPEVIVDPVVSSEEIEKAEKVGEKEQTKKVNNSRNFLKGTEIFVLKETSSGFNLFTKSENHKFATLLKSGGGDNYLFSSEELSGNAFFDTEGNLVVEYLDSESGQLTTVKFNLFDQ